MRLRLLSILGIVIGPLLFACQPRSKVAGNDVVRTSGALTGETRIAFASNRDGDMEIYTMTPTGTDLLKLTNNTAEDRYPAISPDGTRVAFASDRQGVSHIYVMNTDGTAQAPITSGSFGDWTPRWSPDGTRIVFTTNRDGNDELYVMNTDGTGAVRLTNNGAADGLPSFSPDGTTIAFNSSRDDPNGEIYVMNADGTGQTRLTHDTGRQDVYPRWSPSGTKLIWRRDFGGCSSADLWTMNANGSSQSLLLCGPGHDSEAVYSPDGTKIAFSTYRDGNAEIYVMNADSTAPIRLTVDPANDADLDWAEIRAAKLVNHLAAPAVYDNAQSPPYYGQTFVAEDMTFSGVRLYIGDPTRPNMASVDALAGPADLVLYQAPNLSAPVELARTRVVESGAQVGSTNGQNADPVTLNLCAPVPTMVGAKYYFTIEADDGFGLGLRHQFVSTYPGGAEAVRHPSTGQIEENSTGRDTSFEVLSASLAVDSDGDGLSDPCDACPADAANDADGDGICESLDNCPLVANSNQSDNDQDGLGDACEPDGDGDGIVDDQDNCPLAANPDQLDGDGDGIGNACDADTDNDGVVDAGDLCLASGAAEVVDADGCGIAQLCPCAGNWKNHGGYVSCVSRASAAFVELALITQAQRNALVLAAAHSECGRR